MTGKFYDYSLFKYIEYEEPIKIICPIHSVFTLKIYNHKNGAQCPSCSNSGFNRSKIGFLYYIRINKEGQELYKIGVTNRSVKKSFQEEMRYITIIRQYEYTIGQEAYDMEQQILKDYSYAKYTGDPILKSGNTEMFKCDILGWDN